jgi:hypothetical protein
VVWYKKEDNLTTDDVSHIYVIIYFYFDLKGEKMGMYDTIVFEKPLTCKCGNKIESAQTKVFDSVMETYRVGDLVSVSPIISLEKDWTYCDECNAHIEYYIGCSYGIYLGIYESYIKGKEAIDNFGMEQLLKFYVRRTEPSKGLFNRTPIGFMERLVRFYENPKPKKEGKWASVFSLSDFTEETPLEAVKNYLKQDELPRAIKRLYSERSTMDISYKIVDEKLVEIYNKPIQKYLKRNTLFKLVGAKERGEVRPSGDNILVSYRALDEEEILSKVQEWLDEHQIWLRVELR